MQLFLNATSPFARLARVVAIEKGCAAQLQLVWCDPWGDDPALLAVHPQGRIPVLLTDSGQALSESLLIAQYLDGVGDGPSLLPPEQHTTVLATTSVAYGLMESAFATVIARKHHGDAADSSVLGQRRLRAIDRALQWLDTPPLPPCHSTRLASPRWTNWPALWHWSMCNFAYRLMRCTTPHRACTSGCKARACARVCTAHASLNSAPRHGLRHPGLPAQGLALGCAHNLFT